MVFKKGQKPFKKSAPKVEEKVEEVKEEVIEEETPVSSVTENEIKEEEVAKEISSPIVEESDVKTIGEVGGTKVKSSGRGIKFEAVLAPVPMFRLPDELRKYLMTKGFGTDVYKKDKEWLEKHGADIKMIEKLKKWISDNFNS